MRGRNELGKGRPHQGWGTAHTVRDVVVGPWMVGKAADQGWSSDAEQQRALLSSAGRGRLGSQLPGHIGKAFFGTALKLDEMPSTWAPLKPDGSEHP